MTLINATALFVGLTIFYALMAVFWRVRTSRRTQDRLLRDRLRVVAADAPETDEIIRNRPGELHGTLGRMAMMRNLAILLVQGGSEMPLRQFLLLSAIIGASALMLGLLLSQSWVSGVLLALMSWLVVYVILVMRRSRRISQINEQLPKALELMMIALRAGHPIEETIAFAAAELNPPLSTELGRCHDEYQLGRPFEETLKHLAARVSGCAAMRAFAESVIILKHTGGNLIEIIEQIINSMRAQSAFESRFRALTSEGRTSGLILGALPLFILTLVLLLAPGYLDPVFHDPAGHKVIFIAATLWLGGVLWLSRLLRPSA